MRPLFVFGRFDVFQRERLSWSKADRERGRWVRDVQRIRGWLEADFVVFDGYTREQSAAIVVAAARGFTQFTTRELRATAIDAGEREFALALGRWIAPLVPTERPPEVWALCLAAHRLGVLT